MRRHPFLTLAVPMLIAVSGCAHHPAPPALQTVVVPPRIDLKQHEVIGVLEFHSSSDGKLGPLATKRFMEWARHDQGMVRMVELGTRSQVARSLGGDRWDPATIRSLGEQRGLSTVMIGELKIGNVRPDVRMLASLGSGRVSATVEATLSVQMIETSTGASLWSASGGATRSVAQVSVLGGKQFAFDAEDPSRAYGDLLDNLLEQVTRDFRVSYEQR